MHSTFFSIPISISSILLALSYRDYEEDENFGDFVTEAENTSGLRRQFEEVSTVAVSRVRCNSCLAYAVN